MWKTQYQRIIRYREKLETQKAHIFTNPCQQIPPNEYVDDVYTCIIHTHHLKDWLIKSGIITEEDFWALAKDHPQLKIIQDIANSTKHLNSEFQSGEHNVGYEIEKAPYLHRGRENDFRFKFVAQYFGTTHDATQLIDEALETWLSFLLARGIEVGGLK